MQLFLAGLDGRTHTIDVDGAATGAELKELIGARMGVAPSEIRLSVGSAELADDAALDAQGVADKSTVQANGRVRGGYGYQLMYAVAGGVASGVASGVAQTAVQNNCCTVV